MIVYNYNNLSWSKRKKFANSCEVKLFQATSERQFHIQLCDGLVWKLVLLSPFFLITTFSSFQEDDDDVKQIMTSSDVKNRESGMLEKRHGWFKCEKCRRSWTSRSVYCRYGSDEVRIHTSSLTSFIYILYISSFQTHYQISL